MLDNCGFLLVRAVFDRIVVVVAKAIKRARKRWRAAGLKLAA